jgi:putative endonuclease
MYGPWVRVPAGSLESLNVFVQAFLFLVMPCCYILYSARLDKYYVGACTDLARRLYEHNIGHGKFTSMGVPWILKYTESFDSLADAKKREAYIKRMKSRKYIESLFS